MSQKMSSRIVGLKSEEVTNLEKEVTLVLVFTYLFDGEKLSDRNNDLVFQLQLLKLYLGLPFICYGDFNMSPEELGVTGWLERLQASVVKTHVKSTLQNSRSSHIDSFLVPNVLTNFTVDIQPVYNITWKPHLGLHLTIQASPRSVFSPFSFAASHSSPQPRRGLFAGNNSS